MPKKYIDKNVYESALERIEYIFSEFDNVMVAFSGGKDSGVCLNLCYDYAKEHNLLNKLAMYHLDYEAQYQMTTDYVTETFEMFNDIKRYWLCLPVGANCGCRMDAGTWIPWEKEKKDIWVRDMPKYDYVINEENCPFEMYSGQQDYEVQDNFGKWYASQFGKTAVIIGIRTDESLNRFRAIASDKKVKPYKNTNYINGYLDDELTYKAYPIYDWNVQDDWIYNGKFNKTYNKLYDLYYKAGLNIDQMRVANPFHSCGSETLKLYKVIDPNNWGKMIGRVNGVNFAGLYGGTTAMGWKSITKPKHFTWKEYCYFLLDTLDENTRQHYLDKLNTSIKVWREKGCVVSDETLDYLENNNVKFERKGRIKPHTNKEVVAFDEYLDDTNCPNFTELPTYKRMCVCIMKNDYFCKYMGFAQTKDEISKRKRAMEKYANL